MIRPAAFARPVAVALLGAVAGLSGVPAAAAAPLPCRNPPAPGTPLPPGAPRDPTIQRLGLDQAWELSTGRGVTVAVVDSGVDATQPKLRPALVPGWDFVTTQAPPGYQQLPGGIGDCGDNGATHGTAVAGLIAARRGTDDRVVGVAPDARIAPVRFVDGIGNASPQMIAAAIVAGARLGSVLNLSFAVPTDRPEIRHAIQFALSRNVVVVAAAGNESGTGGAVYPAAYPGVLAVAALKPDGTPLDQSNRGAWVGIAAPGANLTAPAAVRGYTGPVGTSFATAVVSGVAALVRSRFPRMRADEVVRRLTATAVPLGAPRDDRVGAGMVDPFAALTAQLPPALAGIPTPPPPTAAVPVQPRPVEPPGLADRWGRTLGVAGLLAVAAVLAYLARLAVRAAMRRRWRAGGGRLPAEPGGGTLEPPDVQLV